MQALPDVPNWTDIVSALGQAFGAIATAAAVIVALSLAIRERRWRRADQTAAAAERNDRDAAQARLVSINVEPMEYGYDPRGTTDVVTVLNGSGEPIHEVSIAEVSNPGAPPESWDYDLSTPLSDMFTTEPRVIPAGEKFTLPIQFQGEHGGLVVSFEPTSVTIQFTDSRGLRWRRTDSNAPVRIIDAED